MGLQVVWFKRDLRIADHAPLWEASQRGPVLPLYIIEPALYQAEDYDACHWSFVRESLLELRASLAGLGQPLVVRHGEALNVLRELSPEAIWAHQETGNGISYQRDRQVRRWARESAIPFTELPSGGVVRRLASRNGWSKVWEDRMAEALVPVPRALPPIRGVEPGVIPTLEDLGLGRDRRAYGQRAGESAGHETLGSFISHRGLRYHAELSSPATAEASCSRLSPYLAYGNLSTRQVIQAAREAGRNLELTKRPEDVGSFRKALRAFDARMHWRCHFMQKLEDEPRIEFENFSRAYDGLREPHWNEEYFTAWKEGRTGYPLVDACMRMLASTGWINFRMRAMLVSFASYHLWLHWRKTSLHLARLFTDYEPGIHYSQMQMQSGTTGINTLRIYSPIKQLADQDADGTFVRRWVPELETPDYPAPIVDHREAMALARQRLGEIRRRAGTREEARAVAEKHGSRKKPAPRKKAVKPTQPMLFS